MSGEMQSVGPNSASGRIKVAETWYDEQTGEFGFDFKDGTQIKANKSQFQDSVLQIATLRGLTETCRDSFAGSKGNVDSAKAECQSRLDTLLSGSWGKSREGTGEGQGALWVEAVARIRGWSVEDARKKLFADNISDEQRKGIKANATVVKTVAEIRLERAQAAVQAAASQADSGADALQALGM